LNKRLKLQYSERNQHKNKTGILLKSTSNVVENEKAKKQKIERRMLFGGEGTHVWDFDSAFFRFI
jgi:hypothetical protein